MSNQARGFDSSANVAYIHGGPQGAGQPPGGDDLEARVRTLEKDMTDIKVMLGRIDERLTGMAGNLATKADVAKIDGKLDAKLGVWQFLPVIAGAVALILAWPKLSALLGV